MTNLTLMDVESAVSAAPSIGERLVILVSLRKRAMLEKQTAYNQWKAGTLTEDECEGVQDTTQAILGLISSHRTGIEALIQ